MYFFRKHTHTNTHVNIKVAHVVVMNSLFMLLNAKRYESKELTLKSSAYELKLIEVGAQDKKVKINFSSFAFTLMLSRSVYVDFN